MKNPEDNDNLNIPADAPEPAEQSVILNGGTKFDNSDIDPGFPPSSEDDPKVRPTSAEQQKRAGDKKETRPDHGLDELDGTNPGSNFHPMDEDV